MNAIEAALEIEKSLRLLRALKQQPTPVRRAELRLTRALQNLFADVADDTLATLARIGRVPSDDTTRRVILHQLLQQEQAFREVIGAGANEAAQIGRNRVIAGLQRQGVGIAFTEFGATTNQLIRDAVFIATERTMNRIAGDVMGNLAISYEEGLGISEAADRLRSEFQEMQDYQLNRIARTEINSFQNEGAHLTNVELGITFEQWWTAEDDRVRDNDVSHVELHGQIVRTGDKFSNGLFYPGDRSRGEATIGEWINCRCTTVPFLMPEGMKAPPGLPWFYPGDLIAI